MAIFANSLWLGAADFLFEDIHLFDWNSRDLRLNVGISGFTRTSLSVCIAQGMARLFLEDKGYTYIGRFSDKLKQCGHNHKTLDSPREKPKQSPDFIIKNSRKERALAKAKDSFVLGGEFDGEAFYGSFFSDGSLLGKIRVPPASRPNTGWIRAKL